MVRAEGLEPPRLTPLEPKSSVSTNSTTPAQKQKLSISNTSSGVPYNTVIADENTDVTRQKKTATAPSRSYHQNFVNNYVKTRSL
jgi:hypothetical protein